jgi:hypothetical protein
MTFELPDFLESFSIVYAEIYYARFGSRIRPEEV